MKSFYSEGSSGHDTGVGLYSMNRQVIDRETWVGYVVVRQLPILIVLVLLFPAFCHAQDLYVSGYRELMLRTGPHQSNKIVAVLKTGDAVTLIRETEDDYSLVALPDGRQGYVAKAYLTEQIPTAHRVQLLEDQVARQNQELARLREENTLLQVAREETQRTATEQKAQLETITIERNQLQQNSRISSFLAGAGVLLIGWLLGWTRLRLRRKSQRRPGLNFS